MFKTDVYSFRVLEKSTWLFCSFVHSLLFVVYCGLLIVGVKMGYCLLEKSTWLFCSLVVFLCQCFVGFIRKARTRFTYVVD